nr:DUF4158 domain-containing protein [Nocardia tengchongensis]
MATRVFADEELQRLRGFPEISREELFRYYTLSPADLAFVASRGRGASVRLGLAVILCSLPWLGFVPDKVTTAPPVAVARLAEQLNVDAAQIRSYSRRTQTRSEHVRLVAQYLGWRAAGAIELKELDEFLLARALEHDSPTLLFRLACEYLIVHSLQPEQGETVVVSGVAGGVGSLAVQLARRADATVIGLASYSNHEWLQSQGVLAVPALPRTYGLAA